MNFEQQQEQKETSDFLFCALAGCFPLDTHGQSQAIRAKTALPEEYNSWVKVTQEILLEAFEKLCVYLGYEKRKFPKMTTLLNL